MLQEFQEFCEDNNLVPPAPLESVDAVPSLSFWSPADPALTIESPPGVLLRGDMNLTSERSVRFQRVVYDIRYALTEVEETTHAERAGVYWYENEIEVGTVPDLPAAYDLAKAWLGGASTRALPPRRSPVV
jgi:hypothetical protein